MTDRPIIAPNGPAGDQLSAAFRQALLLIGGALASRGIIGEGEVEIIAGVVMVIGSFAYGQWKTRKRACQVSILADHVSNKIAKKERPQ